MGGSRGTLSRRRRPSPPRRAYARGTNAGQVFRGESYTEAADVYSYGIILWELYTAQDPNGTLPPLQYAHKVRPRGPAPCSRSGVTRGAGGARELPATAAGALPTADAGTDAALLGREQVGTALLRAHHHHPQGPPEGQERPPRLLAARALRSLAGREERQESQEG